MFSTSNWVKFNKCCIVICLGCDFQVSKACHPGNWSNSGGSLNVNAGISKTQLIHKLGSSLKKLRQTN